jgi:hypothetical protein
MGHFTIVNKESGDEVQASALTMANVQVREGKRVLVELSEVVKP